MYTLHHFPDYASHCAQVALEEMGVPYDVRPIDFDTNDAERPEFRAISPFGLVPALETPDGPIFETGAILLWLSERHGMAPVPITPERAAFLKWFIFVANTLHPGAMALLHPERPAGKAAAREVSRIASANLKMQIDALEAMVQEDAPEWLSGTTPIVLGYYVAMLIRWIQSFPPYPEDAVTLDRAPALRSVLALLETRPAVRRVAEAEGLGEAIYSIPAV